MSPIEGRPNLFLDEADLRGLLTMRAANDAVRNAFRGWSANPGLNALRQRMHAPSGMRVTVHPGISPSTSSGGVLVHCELVDAQSDVQVYVRMAPPVTVVYDADEGQLNAVLVGALSCAELPELQSFTAVRTAATSALGTFAMAREDASVLGVLGTGSQARAHLVSFLTERRFDRVVAFSRDADNRARFATEMSGLLDVNVEALDDARDVVESADILLTATNSNVPVLDGGWLRAGQHVTSIVGSDIGLVRTGQVRTPRRELDDTTLRRATRIGLVSRQQAVHDQQGDIWQHVQDGTLRWDSIVELTGLVSGTPGRTSGNDITVFKNNGGMGVADLAVAGAAYQAAVAAGIGRPLGAASQ